MSEATWAEIDQYVVDTVAPEGAALAEARQACVDAGLPAISVSAAQGKFLQLLASMRGARAMLEIGTLGGYSTIWLAAALPGEGSIITLERDPTHAALAESNLVAAGLGGRAGVRVGPALETLPQLEEEGAGPFDFVFIDADKPSNADYVAWALRLASPGCVIVVDNVVRAGAVLDTDAEDDTVRATRQLYEYLAAEPRLSATVLQTVGSKGHDGFAIAVVQ